MYEPLAPCTRCRRHVRIREAGCPFCGGEIGLARVVIPSLELNRGRVARAGLAAMAFAVVGCTEPTKESVAPDPVVKPVVDAGVAEPKPQPKPLDPGEVDDHGTVHAKYGAAPPPPPVSAMPVPAYGLPPPLVVPTPIPSASTKTK